MSQWLYIDYHEPDGAKSVVVRMDKNNYQTIITAVKTHTGKEVQFLNDADAKPKKDNDKEKDKDKAKNP